MSKVRNIPVNYEATETPIRLTRRGKLALGAVTVAAATGLVAGAAASHHEEPPKQTEQQINYWQNRLNTEQQLQHQQPGPADIPPIEYGQ